MQGVFLFYFTGVVIYKNNVFCETDGPYIPRKKKRKEVDLWYLSISQNFLQVTVLHWSMCKNSNGPL